ncbi:MAG: SH3 domain-containing protein [Deltaproteobacteria bacterium]|nr:SH3 domain-containing protein [Deltaproteobacteria bacterium]
MRRYRVTASALNVRRGPGTNYRRMGRLRRGQVVEPVDAPGWLPVMLRDGRVGWVSARYLEGLPEAPKPGPEPEYDFSTKRGTVEAIKAECRWQGLGLPAQIAYVLATVEWETARKFRPVREAFWLSESWRRHLRYYPYYGRGYVQLTWKENYEKYTAKLRERFPERAAEIDLVADPDQAMVPEYALFILVDGFRTGTFTGRKIEDYINAERTDFINARRCINALDRAEEIAALAEGWFETVRA